MNDVDYARIRLEVAVKVWQESPRWDVLDPTYSHFCELQMDAMSIAYDLTVAQQHALRDGGPPMIAAWRLRR